jgi:hypothetical protein
MSVNERGILAPPPGRRSLPLRSPVLCVLRYPARPKVTVTTIEASLSMVLVS